MQSQKLENSSSRYPQLSDLMESLDQYLGETLAKRGNTQEIVPVLVAKQFSIKEGLALALLMLSEDAGLLVPQYYVYCYKTESLLEKYGDRLDIPEKIYCKYDDKEHDDEEYYIELVFKFTKLGLSEYEVGENTG